MQNARRQVTEEGMRGKSSEVQQLWIQCLQLQYCPIDAFCIVELLMDSTLSLLFCYSCIGW